MAQKNKVQANWLQIAVLRAARVHFVYIAAYMASIVIFDSWNLITHEAVSQRWTAAGLLLVVNTVVWYMARMNFSNKNIYKAILFVLIVGDIVSAGYNVFWQRGVASKAVELFAVPIVTSAVLRSRSALLATATLCVTSYSVAAVRYFNLHYGEGFRIELYGEVGFYSALFFVLAALLLIIIRPKNENL